MKTYLLRDPNSVEPQKAQLVETPHTVQSQNPSHLQAPTSLADISSQGSQPGTLFIGLDVHNDSSAVSLAPSNSTEVEGSISCVI